MTTPLTPEDERLTELLAPLADIPPVPYREQRAAAPRRWLRPVLVAGSCLVAIGIAGAAIVTSGGSDGPTSAAGTTAPPATTTPPATTAPDGATTPPATTDVAPAPELSVFFLQDGQVLPVQTVDPQAGEPGAERRALDALLAGAPDGYESEIPAGTELESLDVADGIATVGLSGGKLGDRAREQVVATLIEAGGIEWVRFGDEPDLFDRAIAAGKGDVRAEPVELARAEANADGTAISFAGTANVFEANVQIRLMQGTKELAHTFVTATCGTGCRGSFDGALDVPAGIGGDQVTGGFTTAVDPLRLEAYTLSAEDGSERDVVGILVTRD